MAKPAIKHILKMIKFLVYASFDTVILSSDERLVVYRKLHGFGQKKLAGKLYIYPFILSKCERKK